MKKLAHLKLNELSKNEMRDISGGWFEILEAFVDLLVEAYGPYKGRGCPGVYNTDGCNSIGTGLSGNTAFTGM